MASTEDAYDRLMADLRANHEIEVGRLRRSGSLPEYAGEKPDSVTQLSHEDKRTLAAIDRWKEREE